MTTLARIGFAADTSGLKKAQAELENTVRSGEKLDKTNKKVTASSKETSTQFNVESTASKKLNSEIDNLNGALGRSVVNKQKNSKAFASMGRASGQAGIQIQQFIGQVQGGQSAMLALSQQSADLGFVLGAPLLGAVVGIGASVVGMLLPSLLKAGNEMSELEKISESLKVSLVETADGTDLLSEKLTKLAKRSESLAKLQIASSIHDAEKQIKTSAQGIEQALDDAFGMTTESILRGFGDTVREAATRAKISVSDLTAELGKGNSQLIKFGKNAGISDTVRMIAKDFDITKTQAAELSVAISDVFNEQSVLNVKALENSLSDIIDTSDGVNAKFSDLVKKLLPLFDATFDGVDKVNLLRKAFGDLNKQLKTNSEEGDKLTSKISGISEGLKSQIIALKDGEEAAMRYAIAQSLELESIKEIPKAISDQINELFNLKNTQKSNIDSFGLMFLALHNQRQQLTMTSDEYEIYRYRLDAIANGVAPEMIEVLVKEKIALQELEKTLGDTSDKTDEWGDITERAADRIDQAFADVWLNISDGFESVTDGLMDSFKRMLAEMAHAAITKPIVMQISAAMGMGGVGGAVGGLGGALGGLLGVGGMVGGSQAGGLLGGLGSLAGGVTALSSLGMLGGAFGAGVGGTTALLGAGSLSGVAANIGGLFSGGSIMAGIGALMPVIAGIAAIAGIADSLTGGGLFGTSYKQTGQDLTLGTSGGDVSGFTTLTEKKKRSLFRGSKTRTTDTAFDTSAIEDIFTNLEFAIVEAAEMLDIDSVTKSVTSRFSRFFDDRFDDGILEALTSTVTMPVQEWLDNFSSQLNIDTEGLSEEEIQNKINAWVEKTTDAMITGVFGDFLGEVQKEGETSADALNRVIINMELFSGIAETLGLSFELTGKEAAIASTNIAELAGGIDNLAALSSQYYSSFFSEQEQFDKLASDLGMAFDELGLSIPMTRDGFRDLVEGLDLTTVQGQEMFAALMQLVPGLDAYLTQLENQGEAVASLEDTLSSAMYQIERAVDAERALADARLSTAQATYQAQAEAIEQQKTLLDSQHSVLTDNLSFAEQQLRDAFSVERAGIQETATARINALNQEKTIISSSVSKLLSIADKFSNAGAGVTVQDALDAAKRGDFSLAEKLSVSDVTDSGFGSAQEMAFAQARQNVQVGQIGSLAGSRASAQQSMLASLDRQISLTESNAAEQMAALDAQLAALMGIDTSVPSLEEAIKLYGQAQQDLDSLNYTEQLDGLNSQLLLAEETLSLAQKTYDDEMIRLDGILAESQKQIEVMLGIDSSVLSVQEAVENLATIIQEINAQAVANVPAQDPTPTNPFSGGSNTDSDVNDAIRASTRANAETADLLQKIYRGEINVRVVNP